MDSIRKPFQGVWNIIRFNWHYYMVPFAFVVILPFIRSDLNTAFRVAVDLIVLLILLSTLISLIVSFYIYDLSDLYNFSWLSNLKKGENKLVININAGFDETSNLLKSKFPNSELFVADFYNPTKHTEISIKRARKAYPPFPNTHQVCTEYLPVEDRSADKVFSILSAHEIRDDQERIAFFKELKRVLNKSGQIIVTEHLRDKANFFAYNFGFFHFHSKASWLKTFRLSGLILAKEIKITPFITTFVLEKNGTSS